MSWTWLISWVFKCSTIFGWACLGMRSLGLEASTSESTSIFRSHDVWDEIPSLAELPVVWGTRESYPSWRPESKTIIFAKPLTLSSIWTPHVLHANSSLHASGRSGYQTTMLTAKNPFLIWESTFTALIYGTISRLLYRRGTTTPCHHHHPSLPQPPSTAIPSCSHVQPYLARLLLLDYPFSWNVVSYIFFPFNVGIMVLTLRIIQYFNTY